MIGNGFDVNVGLHTSYPEFLNYYLKQLPSTGIDEVGQRYIKRIKTEIKNDLLRWSDFELVYGKYMSELGKMGSDVHPLDEELEIINDDIREKLSAYIANEDRHSFFAENAKKQFLESILKPEIFLRDYEMNDINNKRNNIWNRSKNTIDFITFNYTKTIEHLLDKNHQQFSGYNINEPVHVHGYYDNRMILGVNDVSQINNEELKKNAYALDTLVKSRCNHVYGVGHTDKTTMLITNAQLLCTFGLSFGDTDKIWWQQICQQFIHRNDLMVIIFWYVNDFPDFSNGGPKLQRIINEVKDMFLSKGGIGKGDLGIFRNRVYVAINKPIFNFRVDDRTPLERLTGKSAPGTLERFVEEAEMLRNKGIGK